jgi:hypothetical protein
MTLERSLFQSVDGLANTAVGEDVLAGLTSGHGNIARRTHARAADQETLRTKASEFERWPARSITVRVPVTCVGAGAVTSKGQVTVPVPETGSDRIPTESATSHVSTSC